MHFFESDIYSWFTDKYPLKHNLYEDLSELFERVSDAHFFIKSRDILNKVSKVEIIKAYVYVLLLFSTPIYKIKLNDDNDCFKEIKKLKKDIKNYVSNKEK